MTKQQKAAAKSTGRMLRDYRKVLGLKQEEMAKTLKVSKSIWTKWENGLVNIPDWAPDAVRRLGTCADLSSFSADEITVINRRAKESGKTMEEYIVALVRGTLFLIFAAITRAATF